MFDLVTYTISCLYSGIRNRDPNALHPPPTSLFPFRSAYNLKVQHNSIMSTATNPIFLPITTVQHDFEVVVTDVREGTVPSEDFWISCYHQNEPSVHGKVRAELDGKDRHLVLLNGRDGVQIERGDQVCI